MILNPFGKPVPSIYGYVVRPENRGVFVNGEMVEAEFPEIFYQLKMKEREVRNEVSRGSRQK
jgi:hypothetical protein